MSGQYWTSVSVIPALPWMPVGWSLLNAFHDEVASVCMHWTVFKMTVFRLWLLSSFREGRGKMLERLDGLWEAETAWRVSSQSPV